MSNSKYPFHRKGQFLTSRAILLASAAVTALAPAAHAQFRASITGTVTDSSGAVIPGAQVTLVDKQTGKSLQATTNGTGDYNFNALPPDTFTLTTAMSGFSTKTINDLTITPEQANNINVQLAVSSTGASVEVTADAVSPLETATGSISGTISSNEIQHLPTAGRDVFQLLQLTPGAFGDGQRSAGGGTNSIPGSQGPGGSGAGQGAFATENGPQVVSNGGQYETNAISINGISTTSAVWGGTSIITPNQDSVDTVKITSNGYDAEFGRFSGANVEITTKAGTNSFHGSAFFRAARPGLNAFNRYNGPNSLLPFTLGPGAANTNVNRAAAHGLLRDTTRNNDIGGSVGGPILKNRVFAFFAYETIRAGQNDTVNRANHLTALTAKALIRAYYGQPLKFASFSGCSDVARGDVGGRAVSGGLRRNISWCAGHVLPGAEQPESCVDAGCEHPARRARMQANCTWDRPMPKGTTSFPAAGSPALSCSGPAACLAEVLSDRQVAQVQEHLEHPVSKLA